MHRMTFGQFLETIRRAAPIYEELVQREAIQPRVKGEDLVVDLHPVALSPAVKDWLRPQLPCAYRDLIHWWLISQLVAKGPKVFQPSLERCLALEQIEIRLPVADYAQPYPVMVVDLPEAYQKQRVCPPPADASHGAWGAPTCVLIGTPPPGGKAIWLSIVFDSGTAFRLALGPMDATIEAGLIREFGADSYFPAVPITPEESRILASVVRVAVNAMLMLMQYGCRSEGPADASLYQRLQRYVAVARKKQRGIAEAERNLRLATQLYGLPQEIQLYKQERSQPREASDDASEAMRRPHWRRGHWKMHAHGVGRSQRKRILIKPKLVNGYLLCDGAKIPQTTYRIRS